MIARLSLVSLTITGTLLSLAYAPAARAQFSLTGLERPLTLSMTPEYPMSGDTVRLTVQSYGLDLNRSEVVWYENEKEIARGTGVTTASVTAGALGSRTTVEVVAEDEAGLIGSAQATIRPTEVDLLWESDSYVPPFYEGRALPGTSAIIRAQALARFKQTNGTLLPDTSIIYTWYKGNTRMSSGRGRSSFSFPGPTLFGTDDIRVVAESTDGTLRGEARTRIQSVDPSLELYENHPLFGVLFHRALVSGARTTETEEEVVAFAYFAHVESPRDQSLTYVWRVNDQNVTPDPKAPHTLLITTNNYTGPATIELSLTSLTDIFLRATGSWQLTFIQGNATIFGTDPFTNQ
ncbi:MAG: hypothetical protein AAB605_02720 [Patescibacteria group bacterium]